MTSTTSIPVWRKALTIVFVTVALLMLAMVSMMAWNGGEWTVFGYTAKNARGRLEYAALALLAAYFAGTGFRKTRREWLTLAGRLFFLCTSLALSLLIAEIGLRAYLRNNQGSSALSKLKAFQKGESVRVHANHPLAAIVRLSDNKKLIYELIPNMDKNFGHRRVKTNSHGMRDSHEYSPERTNACIRIVGIGDSGMFGWGVHQDQDYLAALESNLNARADLPLCEVMNMGVPGYNTAQEVETFRSKGLQFAPNIVVVSWCENDFDIPFFLLDRNEYDRRDLSYLITFLFDRELYQKLLIPRMKKLNEIDHSLVDPEILKSAGPEGVERSLAILKTLADQNGFKILLFGPMKADVMGMCDTLGIAYFNIYTRIARGTYPREFGIYFMHPRAGGHAALARELEKELDTLGWLQLDTPDSPTETKE